MHLPLTARVRRASRDEGSVLIEVVVTATLLVIVALGVLKALDAADARGAGQKGKAVAGNLAQAEQERLRSLTLDELSNYSKPPRIVTQGGAAYTVASRAEWVTDATGEASCATGGASADYLKITTTVTAPALRGRKPVTLDSILSPPARAFQQSEGSLAVKISDRDGVGVPGLSLSLSGTENVSGITNEKGCVLWGYLTAAADYALTYSRAGWLDPSGATSITSTQGVVGEQTRTVEFQYDEGGSLRTNFVTRRPPSAGPGPGTLVPSKPGFTTVEHPGPPSTLKSFPMTGSAIDTPLLFPFDSAYTVYADKCAGANPSTPRTKIVDPGPVSDAGEIELPAIDVRVTNSSGPVAGAQVVVTSACGTRYARTTGSDGRLDDPGYPFGTGFTVCASDGTKSFTATGIDNSSLTGQTIDIDLANATGTTCA